MTNGTTPPTLRQPTGADIELVNQLGFNQCPPQATSGKWTEHSLSQSQTILRLRLNLPPHADQLIKDLRDNLNKAAGNSTTSLPPQGGFAVFDSDMIGRLKYLTITWIAENPNEFIAKLPAMQDEVKAFSQKVQAAISQPQPRTP